MLVILVRHPAPSIEAGRCYGRLDVGLSAAGEAAIAGIAAALPCLPVLTSPARRCRRVAARLSAAAIVETRLQELDFGDWEGMAWDDVPRAALDAWAADPLDFAPPGGESGAMLIHRVDSLCRDLVASGRDCILVGHGGPLKLIANLLRGEKPDLLGPAPGLGSITTIECHPASTVSTAHSVATAQAPRTSPVKPPI